MALFGRRPDSRGRVVTGPVRIRTSGTIMAFSPFKFLQEVRTETDKVTWPTRRETAITTVMVFVMATVAAIFFLIGDQIIRIAVTTILGIGS